MNELPHLARPIFLLLAVPGAIVVFLLTLRRRGDHATRSFLHGTFRALLLIGLAFFLSAPHHTTVRDRPVVRNILVDTSHSISSSRWKRTMQSVIEAVERPPDDRPTRVFLFAGHYRHVLSYRDGTWSPRPDQLIRNGRSGLKASLRNSLDLHRTRILPATKDLLTGSAGHRVVENIVITDGHAHPSREIHTARGTTDGRTVFVPLDGARDHRAVINRIQAPRRVRSGEPFPLRLSLRSTRPTNASLTIWIDGTKQEPIDVSIPEDGPRTIRAGPFNPFPDDAVENKQLVRIRARLTPADDGLTAHTARTGTVLLPPLQIRSLSGGDEPGPVTRAIRTQGQNVRSLPSPDGASDALTSADLLFMNPPLPNVSSSLARTIRSFVRRDGGGLLIVSGTGSSARKRLTTSPIRDLLPVQPIEPPPKPDPEPAEPDVEETASSKPPPDPEDSGNEPPEKKDNDDGRDPVEHPDPPDDGDEGEIKRGRVSTVSLILVIDKSGSMTGKKIGLVKEAAIAALDTLDDDDRIGVIAFDHRPRLVTEPIHARRKTLYKRRIARLYAGGGTNSFRALRAAGRLLKKENAGLKHIILLSDGKTSLADFQSLLKTFRKRNITVSTVAAGQNAGSRLMARIARWGNGNFHETSGFENIPQIFTSETRALVKASEKKADQPEPPTSSPDQPEDTLPRSARADTSPDSSPDTDKPPQQPDETNPDADPDPEPGTTEPEPEDTASDRNKTDGEKTLKPVLKREPVPLLHGFSSDDFPPVREFLRSRRRSLALLPLVVKTPSGREFPFFSYGYAGSGTVGVFLTDFNGTEAPDWTTWTSFPRLIGQTVRAMARTQNWDALHPAFQFQRAPGAGPATLRITIPEEIRNTREVQRHRLSWRSIDGTDNWNRIPLNKRGTGRYRTSFTPPDPGSYLEFRLSSTLKDGREFTYYHVVPSSIPPEFQVRGVNRNFFRTARKSGHAVINTSAAALRRPDGPDQVKRTTVPVPTWPLALLGLAIVLEVYLTTRTS